MFRHSAASALALLAVTAVGLSGCGSGSDEPTEPLEPTATGPAAEPGPSPQAQLAGHAAAAKDRHAVATYTLHAERGEETVMALRALDGSWRVDVSGGGLGGDADIALVGTGGEMFQCVLAGPDHPRPTCARVTTLTADINPRVQHLFTDWLDVLTDRAAPLAVVLATPPDGVEGNCFSVEPITASLVPPLDAGIYCFDADGTLTGARLGFGTLVLQRTDPTDLPTAELPGPVVDADPMPTAAPSPEPTPEDSDDGPTADDPDESR